MTRQASAVSEHESLGPSTIAWTETFRIRSEAIGQDFLIEIAKPPGPLPQDRALPVVFVLDGNMMFGPAAAAARLIQAGPAAMPATLVVGVGYHFEKPEDRIRAAMLRVRDLTPCTDALLEQQYPALAATTGGAAAFLDFLRRDLTPFLASRYPIDPEDRTLVGSSLAGLFALHTLFTAPDAFRRYVAISPAIYWGDGALLGLEAALAARATDLSAHVFLGAGALEEAHDPRQAFVSNVYRLEAALRARRYPSLALERRIFERETHMSVYPGAVTYGLASVFGGYRDMDDWSRWLGKS